MSGYSVIRAKLAVVRALVAEIKHDRDKLAKDSSDAARKLESEIEEALG